MEPRAQKQGMMKRFFIGKGAKSRCPFHRMNSRIAEKTMTLWQKGVRLFHDRRPLMEAPARKERKENQHQAGPAMETVQPASLMHTEENMAEPKDVVSSAAAGQSLEACFNVLVMKMRVEETKWKSGHADAPRRRKARQEEAMPTTLPVPAKVAAEKTLYTSPAIPRIEPIRPPPVVSRISMVPESAIKKCPQPLKTECTVPSRPAMQSIHLYYTGTAIPISSSLPKKRSRPSARLISYHPKKKPREKPTGKMPGAAERVAPRQKRRRKVLRIVPTTRKTASKRGRAARAFHRLLKKLSKKAKRSRKVHVRKRKPAKPAPPKTSKKRKVPRTKKKALPFRRTARQKRALANRAKRRRRASSLRKKSARARKRGKLLKKTRKRASKKAALKILLGLAVPGPRSVAKRPQRRRTGKPRAHNRPRKSK